MKKLFIVLLFLLLTFLLAINENISSGRNSDINESYNPFLKARQTESQIKGSSSKFNIEFKTFEDTVFVLQELTWINNTSFPTDSIYICLPLNAFRNAGSDYFKEITYSEQMRTGYQFSRIEINGVDGQMNFRNSDINPSDSSIAVIVLPNQLLRDDSVKIRLDYKFNVSQGSPGFGYSKGNKFCLLADWHPFITRYENGKWDKQSFTKYFKPVAEPVIFSGEFSIDKKVIAASSAMKSDESIEDNNARFSFTQEKGRKLTIAFYDKVITDKINFEPGETNYPEIEIFLLDENERYLDRVKKAVKISVEYLIDNIGPFPFKKLSIVNVPNKTNFGFQSYSSVITMYCDLISPVSLLDPEYGIVRMLAKQYYGSGLNIIDDNDMWIKEGVPSYLAGNILQANYGSPHMYFKLAGYFPIYGLNFLSYNEIPIIYTLNEFPYSPGMKDIFEYYKHLKSNPIVDSRFSTDPDYLKTNQSVKPALILKSLANSLGDSVVVGKLNKLYNSQESLGITAKFLDEFSESSTKQFLKEAFLTSVYFDYKVDNISRLDDETYEVEVSRTGSGTCPVTINMYTDSDTLSTAWDGGSRKYKCIFKTSFSVVAAEVDPGLAALLDLNKANNSYTFNEKYWGSLSIVIRAFFWFQNALMIFGSIG